MGKERERERHYALAVLVEAPGVVHHILDRASSSQTSLSLFSPQSETKKVAEAEQKEREKLLASVEETVKELEEKRLLAENQTRERMEEHEKYVTRMSKHSFSHLTFVNNNR